MKKEEYTGVFTEVFEETGVENKPIYHPKNNCSIGQGYKWLIAIMVIIPFCILNGILINLIQNSISIQDSINHEDALFASLITGLYVFCVSFVNFYIARKIYKKCIFKKYSNSTVYMIDGNWKCPCCSFHNCNSVQCEKCGISPHLVDDQSLDDSTIDL